MSGYERLLSEHRWTTVARRTGRGYDFSPVCMCGEATRTEVAHERHLASVLADAERDARADDAAEIVRLRGEVERHAAKAHQANNRRRKHLAALKITTVARRDLDESLDQVLAMCSDLGDEIVTMNSEVEALRDSAQAVLDAMTLPEDNGELWDACTRLRQVVKETAPPRAAAVRATP